MKTVPTNIIKLDEKGAEISHVYSEIRGKIVAKYNIEKVDEEFVKKTPEEIVDDFFLTAFNTKEGEVPKVPQGYERYETCFNKIAAIVELHKQAETAKKEKADLEKKAKEQQKEAARKAKEEEDKFFDIQDKAFQETLVATISKTKDTAEQAMTALTKSIKLPKSISFSSTGSGLVISDDAKPEDFATAAANIVAGFEKNAAAEAALQFSIGDLINASVAKKIYRSKSDAQSAISLALKEKAGRSYVPGSLAQYATMAERISIEDRKPGVSPSLYLVASKVVPQRDKGLKGEELAEKEKEFSEARKAIVEKINNGEVSSIKDAQKEIRTVYESLGVSKKESPGEKKAKNEASIKSFFYWFFISKELVGKHKEGVAILRNADKTTVEVSAEETKTQLVKAYNECKEILVPNLDLVSAGKKTVKEDGKDVEIPFFMLNPWSEPASKIVKEVVNPLENKPEESQSEPEKPKAEEVDPGQPKTEVDEVELEDDDEI